MPERRLQPVGARVLDNYSFLKHICKTRSAKKQTKLLKEATTDQLLSLVEVCSNILRGRFTLNNRQKAKLHPFASVLRKLARARSERTARRIVQTGGGPLLPALLAPILFHAAQHLIQKFDSSPSDGK